MSEHLLLRVSAAGALKNGSQEALYQRACSVIRGNDVVGIAPDNSLCLLLDQAGDASYEIIRKRLEGAGLAVERLSAEDERRLFVQEDGRAGAGTTQAVQAGASAGLSADGASAASSPQLAATSSPQPVVSGAPTASGALAASSPQPAPYATQAGEQA